MRGVWLAIINLKTDLNLKIESEPNFAGYDRITSAELGHHPEAYYAYPESGIIVDGAPAGYLDDELAYIGMLGVEWWQGAQLEPTARRMYSEHAWGAYYERGTFVERSHLAAVCAFEWDDTVLLANSADPTASDFALDGELGLHDYEERVWRHLRDEYGDDAGFAEAQRMQTWAAKTCNFKRQSAGREPCYVPVAYETETCADEDGEDGLTLSALLGKEGVAGNACLEEVRRNAFAYAKSMGLLSALCRGDMDATSVCQAPTLDFAVDGDDEAYLDKLRAVQRRMQQERAEADADAEEMSLAASASAASVSAARRLRWDLACLALLLLLGAALLVWRRARTDSASRREQKAMARHDEYGSLL